MNCPTCRRLAEPGDRYCEQCGNALVQSRQRFSQVNVPMLPAMVGAPAVTVAARAQSRYWAMGAHLSAIAGGFMGGIPAFVGPLLVWLLRRDSDPFAATHGRAALNFNLSVLMYGLALVIISIVTLGVGLILAIPAGIVLAAGWLVFSLVGAIKAANDEPMRYPFTIPFVK